MMSGDQDMISFCRTVRGASHTRKDIVCQDASAVFEDEDGRFCIAAAADGHGDPACMRSERGSRIAVSEAIECMKEFAEGCCRNGGLTDKLLDRRTRKRTIRQLTDAVTSRWAERVQADLCDGPLTDQELALSGEFEEAYKKGEFTERIYGTTLIAVLKTDSFLLMIQQGDGRCDLIRPDGTVSSPMPEDKRCRGNITTSLSDDDAAEGIRNCLVSLSEIDAAACVISTDGLDNSFTDDDSMNDFLAGSCVLIKESGSEEEREKLLETMLGQISERGSGDDVSAAGMIFGELTCGEQR